MYHHAFTLLAITLVLFPNPVASYTYYQDSESCDLVGDTDIYGIGIRVSIYLQSLTAVLAHRIPTPGGLYTQRIGSNSIATAIVLNFLKEIPRKGFVYLEFWIIIALLQVMLWVCNLITCIFVLEPVWKDMRLQPLDLRSLFGLLFFRITPKPGANEEIFWRTLHQSVMGVGYINIAWTLLLLLTLSVTQAWLYFGAVRRGYHENCATKINFYGVFDLYDEDWVNFLKAGCILSILLIISLINNFLDLYFKRLLGFFFKPGRIHKDEPTALKTVKKWVVGPFCQFLDIPNWFYKETPLSIPRHKASSLLRGICLIFGLIAWVSSIMWTESTIQANNIDLSTATISSSSQLMALIVAAFTSVPTLWNALLRSWVGKKEKMDENSEHGSSSINEVADGMDLQNMEPEPQNVSPVVGECDVVDAANIV